MNASARISTFSQELRVTSPAHKKVEFVAGLYFSKTNTFDTVVQGGFAGIVPGARFGRGSQVSIEQTSYAAFGQSTIHVNDKLALIAGGRFTHDRLKDKARPYTPLELAPYGFLPIELLPFGFRMPAPLDLDFKEDNFSWKLGAQYEVSPRLNVYFTASRGYKGAASNDQADPAIVPVLIRSEKPMFFELGAKATLIDRKLFGTIALFSNKVNNYQTDVFTPATAANPVPGFAQGNAPYILSQGIDLNVFGKITPELTFNAGVIYNRAKYAPNYVVQCSQVQVPGTGSRAYKRLTALGRVSPLRGYWSFAQQRSADNKGGASSQKFGAIWNLQGCSPQHRL